MKLLNIVELHAISGGLDPAIVNKPIGALTISEIGELIYFLDMASDREINALFPWMQNFL